MQTAWSRGGVERPSNKRMKLTRLAAAPGTPTQGAAAWTRALGTGSSASQLMRGVLRTQVPRSREHRGERER